MKPDPTPVASGLSPVTGGDLAYVIEMLPGVAPWRRERLAEGSDPGPNSCAVCSWLRLWPERDTTSERAAADALLGWHGSDAIRCGVLYGVAAALTTASQQIQSSKGENDA